MDTLMLKRTNSLDTDFRILIAELDQDLRDRNGSVMDIYDQHNVIEYIDTVVIAYVNDKPAGCGCFKNYDGDTVEMKRMFVCTEARGNGISRKVLTELETWAAELGFRYTVLETGSKQTEALALYQRSGYTLIAPYGLYTNLPDSVCFRKVL